MTKYLVLFTFGESGWYGTANRAAKSVEANNEIEAIAKIKAQAMHHYADCRDFQCWIAR